MSPKLDRSLAPPEAADLLGYTVKTLASWRYLGRGPRYTKGGTARTSRIRYRHSDLVAWMEAHTQGGEAA